VSSTCSPSRPGVAWSAAGPAGRAAPCVMLRGGRPQGRILRYGGTRRGAPENEAVPSGPPRGRMVTSPRGFQGHLDLMAGPHGELLGRLRRFQRPDGVFLESHVVDSQAFKIAAGECQGSPERL